MKKNSLKGILLVLVVLFLPTVNAFANTFLEDKTMDLWKGETGEYCVYLQNTGEEDIKQVIKVFEGTEHIKNLDEVSAEFDVPAGTVSDNLPICMEVKLPKESVKTVKYMVSYGVANAQSKDEQGMVSLAPVQIREKFYLTEKLEPKEQNLPVVPLAIAATSSLVAVGYVVYRKKRKAKP